MASFRYKSELVVTVIVAIVASERLSSSENEGYCPQHVEMQTEQA